MRIVYVENLLMKHGAVFAESVHIGDQWKVRLWFRGGTFRDVGVARNATIINFTGKQRYDHENV